MTRGTALAQQRWAIIVPFAAFIGLFLLYPVAVVVYRAVTPGGSIGLDLLQAALQGSYLSGFMNSSLLSAVSAIIGGVLGLLLALVIASIERPRWLRSTLDGWSAVASQLGGVPLAFAFIATIGTQGILTKLLAGAGINLADLGVSVSGFWGLVVVYLYFQVPLMFLIMMPAVSGLRRSWREAAALLGASGWRYWVTVGLPLLAPAWIGGVLLLFVNAFSAYATAYVLNSGSQLVPLQIRFLLQGNVISGQEDLGYAIVTWVLVLLLAGLLGMAGLQRMSLRWLAA
ncbi:MAG: ABC transporter permease subunit [Actinomycetales bacterium]|nr:ABC transporter permease subunit [Actinomycetales bacterium]